MEFGAKEFDSVVELSKSMKKIVNDIRKANNKFIINEFYDSLNISPTTVLNKNLGKKSTTCHGLKETTPYHEMQKLWDFGETNDQLELNSCVLAGNIDSLSGGCFISSSPAKSFSSYVSTDMQRECKKSKKKFVPDEMKDKSYCAKRKRNNLSAKRSRDPRRQKEEELIKYVRNLSDENAALQQELEHHKWENRDLRARLAKIEAE